VKIARNFSHIAVIPSRSGYGGRAVKFTARIA
jgi:hypothetical protein